MDILPKPVLKKVPMLITGASQQSPDWLARHGEGWITYSRRPELQAKIIYSWRFKVQEIGGFDKPVSQSLYIDLMDDPDAKLQPIHLSSAAQATVSLDAFMGKVSLSDGEAYAQSKLALTMFTFYLAKKLKNQVSSMIAVNPASLLGTKMVKEGYGISGKDMSIGSGILTRMVVDATFSNI